MPNGSDLDAELEAANLRVWRSRGRMIGMLLGVTLLGLGFAYAAGAFDRPAPPTSASPCNGRTVNLDEDPENCGYCGNACPTERPACRYGTCECGAESMMDCSYDEPCADLETSMRHCGSCEHTCEGDAECVNGACECAAGLSACDTEDEGSGTSATSCADVRTDPLNCGHCGVVCPDHGDCLDGVCGGGTAGVR